MNQLAVFIHELIVVGKVTHPVLLEHERLVLGREVERRGVPGRHGDHEPLDGADLGDRDALQHRSPLAAVVLGNDTLGSSCYAAWEHIGAAPGARQGSHLDWRLLLSFPC